MFTRRTKRLSSAPTPFETPTSVLEVPDPFVVADATDLQILENILSDARTVTSFDTETIGCDPRSEHPRFRARATSCQFSLRGYPHIYLDNYQENSGRIKVIKRWAEDPNKPKVGHNIKYDLHTLTNHGIYMKGVVGDTLGMDYLLDTSAKGEHDLETCIERWKGVTLDNYSQTFSWHPPLKSGKGDAKRAVVKPHYQWWDEGDRERVIKYAVKDAYWGLWLYEHHQQKLRGIPWAPGKSYWDYYKTIELPIIDVVFWMEQRGIRVDTPYLEELKVEFDRDIAAHGEAFFKALTEAGVSSSFLESFNPNSSQQLANVLFDMLGYPVLEWTDGGKSGVKQRSVDASTLKVLREEHGCEVIGPLLEKRALEKLQSTYVEALLDWSKVGDGRIRTSFNPFGSATERFTSSNPNLQNIPVRFKVGKKLRQAFVPRDGYVFGDSDYAAIEARLAAHFSKDHLLIKNFEDDLDPHAMTAYHLYDDIVKPAVDAQFGGPTRDALLWVKANHKDLRERSKTWNYMVVYGGGEQRAMAVFGVTKEKARDMIDSYFETYPGLRRMIEGAHEEARQNGYITSLLNARMHIPDIHSPKFGFRKAAERQAANGKIQKSAGEIIKMAMILIHQDPTLRSLGVETLLQVHDELVFEIPDDEGVKVQAKPILDDYMSNSYRHFGFRSLRVATPAEVSYGWTWGDAKDG